MIFKPYNNMCPNNHVYFMQGLLLHIWQIKKPHQTSVSDFMHSAKLTLLLSEMWPPYASNSINLWKVLRTKVIRCFRECLLQLFCGFSLSCLFMLSQNDSLMLGAPWGPCHLLLALLVAKSSRIWLHAQDCYHTAQINLGVNKTHQSW